MREEERERDRVIQRLIENVVLFVVVAVVLGKCVWSSGFMERIIVLPIRSILTSCDPRCSAHCPVILAFEAFAQLLEHRSV